MGGGGPRRTRVCSGYTVGDGLQPFPCSSEPTTVPQTPTTSNHTVQMDQRSDTPCLTFYLFTLDSSFTGASLPGCPSLVPRPHLSDIFVWSHLHRFCGLATEVWRLPGHTPDPYLYRTLRVKEVDPSFWSSRVKSSQNHSKLPIV